MSGDRRLRLFTAWSAWLAVLLISPAWVSYLTLAGLAVALAWRLRVLARSRRAERSA